MVTVCRGCTGRCRFRGIIRVCVVARTSLPPQQTVGSLRRCAPRRPGVRRVAARVPLGDRGANRGSPCAAVRVRPRRPVLGGGTYDRSNRLVYPQSRTAPPGTSETSLVRGSPALRSPLSALRSYSYACPRPTWPRVCAAEGCVFRFLPYVLLLVREILTPGSVYVPIPALLAAGAALLAVPAYRPA